MPVLCQVVDRDPWRRRLWIDSSGRVSQTLYCPGALLLLPLENERVFWCPLEPPSWYAPFGMRSSCHQPQPPFKWRLLSCTAAPPNKYRLLLARSLDCRTKDDSFLGAYVQVGSLHCWTRRHSQACRAGEHLSIGGPRNDRPDLDAILDGDYAGQLLASLCECVCRCIQLVSIGANLQVRLYVSSSFPLSLLTPLAI